MQEKFRKSKNTRDIRSLGMYEYHFKKYNREILNPRNVSKNTIGMLEDIDGELVFIPVLYNGHLLDKAVLKSGYRVIKR